MSGEDRGRRKGRGRGGDEVPSEELGWIDDLRQARDQGGDLGPGSDLEQPPPTRSGRRGPGGRGSGGPDQPDGPPEPAAGGGGSRRERREAREARSSEERREESRWAGLRSPEPDPDERPPGDARRPDERPPGDPRRDGPRGGDPPGDPRRDGPRGGDPPGDPRRDSTTNRLGSRFASLRGLRGGERTPEVPAPAVPPLPPEVLNPGRGMPPARDTEPGRPSAPGPVPSGRSGPPRPPEPGARRPVSGPPRPPEPGARRPVSGPPRPPEPGWHDLATGERPAGAHAGRSGPPPAGPGTRPVGPGQPGQPIRRGTGEQPPVRRGEQPGRHATGEQTPVRRGTGEQSPVRRGTGEQSPVRRGTGEQAPVRRGTGEQPTLDRPLGRRGQLRQQVRDARQFRLVALGAVAVVLLALLPAIFLVRDASGDPVLAGLDSLELPSWAAQSHQDQASGNRWCVDTCRLRERTWRSTKPAADTDPVYQRALISAGWRPWHTPGCPTANGSYTCWQRDEYVLDLWTRDTPCDLASLPPVPPAGGPSATATPVAPPTGTEPPATCAGSLVTAKVANRVDPNWHG